MSAATRSAALRIAFGFVAAQLIWVVLLRAEGSAAPITLLSDMLVGAGWGIGAWIGVFWRRIGIFRQVDRDVSWTGALWGGAIFAIAAGVPLLGVSKFPPLADAVAVATMVNFIGAKLGCASLGCCPAALNAGRRPVWPNGWGPGSLAGAECMAAVATVLCAPPLADEPGDIAIQLVFAHFAIRAASRLLRAEIVSWATLRSLGVEALYPIAALTLLTVAASN